MYRDISLSRFCDINSSIHKLNPVVKIISFLIFIVIILLKNDLAFVGILALLLLYLILMSNISFKVFFKELSKIKYFVLLLFVFNALLSVSLELNIVVLLKIILVSLYSSLFILTTDVNSIMYGFNVLLCPLRLFGIRVYDITVIIALVITFIPNILEEGMRIFKAISIRGLDFWSGSIREKLKIFSMAFIPMFNMCFLRSDRIGDILDVRNYNSSRKRTNYKSYNFRFNDIVMLLIHIIFVAAVIIKDVVL